MNQLVLLEASAACSRRLQGMLIVCGSLFAAILFLTCGTSSGQAPSTNPAQLQLDKPLADAKFMLDEGMINEADRAVRQYVDKHPHSADGHFLLGYIIFKELQAGASLEGQTESPLNNDPVGTNSNVNESNAKTSLAEYTEGAKYRDPGPFDLKIVALNYVLLHDYQHADKWLTRSVRDNPGDSEGWYYLGRIKYFEDIPGEAISAFEHCLRLAPKKVEAEDGLGLVYERLTRTEEAIAAYRRAISWQEPMLNKDPGPFMNLGSLLLDQNRTEEAVSYLLQAVEISPRESRAHEKLGKAYSRLNQFQDAQTELEKAVTLAPQDAHLHYMLAQVYRKQGLKEKAKVELDRFAVLREGESLRQRPRDGKQ